MVSQQIGGGGGAGAANGVPPGGTTGFSLVKASESDYDTEWMGISAGRIQFPGFSTVSKSDGNFTIPVGGSFAAVDVALDLAIPALVDDLIAVTINRTVAGETGGGSCFFDLATVGLNDDLIKEYFSSEGAAPLTDGLPGFAAWPGSAAADGYDSKTPTAYKRIVAEDFEDPINDTFVKVRLVVRQDAGVGRAILATAGHPIIASIINHGQPVY